MNVRPGGQDGILNAWEIRTMAFDAQSLKEKISMDRIATLFNQIKKKLSFKLKSTEKLRNRF